MARAQRRQTEAVKHAEQKSNRVMWGGMLAGGALAVGILVTPGLRGSPEETVTPVEIEPAGPRQAAAAVDPKALRAQVIHRYPHDRTAFTQGLLWHDGALYESTGQYGRSLIRRVKPEDGKVLSERALDPKRFGEGLARVGDRLVQLTWQAEEAIVYDIGTLEPQKVLTYTGEGWGLCFDGTSLVMSDGSAVLTFRDPETMNTQRRLTIRKNGRPVDRLNELECVGDRIYANVWQSDEILRIDARSGVVDATIDASELLSGRERVAADVLNGIAYNPQTNTFFVTGKLWPTLFEVEWVKADGSAPPSP